MGMVCRGEVALIVANRGLAMGVLSAAMMTPVVITVVGGTILTPILLKLAFHGDSQGNLVESSLADRYEKDGAVGGRFPAAAGCRRSSAAGA